MKNSVDLTGFIDELHSHPNLLMWMAGHRHVNTVKAFVHDNPEQAFWQVETSSLLNFPQQPIKYLPAFVSEHGSNISGTGDEPIGSTGQ